MSAPNVSMTAIKLEQNLGTNSKDNTDPTATSVHKPSTVSSMPLPTAAVAQKPSQLATSSVPAPVPSSTLSKPQLPVLPSSASSTVAVPVSTLPHIQPQKQSKSRQRPQQVQAAPRYQQPGSPAAPRALTNGNSTVSTVTTVRRHPPVAHPLPNIKQPQPLPPSNSKQSKKKKATVTMATTQTATPASTQGENTGRWTAEEHRLFLQGLEQHGKGWKKIASLIKSRTVVQIRTHAQKYFQKLAKARQNGEEGDVSMENRERTSISSSAKRRRGGTKRKAIASVVASAEREGKRRASAAAASKNNDSAAVADPSSQGEGQLPSAVPSMADSSSTPLPSNPHNMVPLPTVAPALAPFVYPLCAPPSIAPAPNGTSGANVQPLYHPNHLQQPCTNNSTAVTNSNNLNNNMGSGTGISVPSITTAHGTISGAALEDSLFRFLTPAPNEPMNAGNSTQTSPTNQVNDIARQAGANPITLPSSNISVDKNNANNFQTQVGGDVSPTGVADFQSFPTNWVWQSGEPPSWYTKGADVDELLNEAEALDWLADSGDLSEEYTPPPEEAIHTHHTNVGMEGNECTSSKLSEPSLLSLTAENNSQLKPDNVNVIESNSNNCASHIQQSNPTHPVVNMAPSVPTLENTTSMNKGVPLPDHKGISPTPSALNIPPLPSLFESSNDLNTMKKSSTKPSLTNLSSVSLFTSATEAADAVSSGDLLLDSDTQFDEQAFVTALLDQDSNNNLLSHQ